MMVPIILHLLKPFLAEYIDVPSGLENVRESAGEESFGTTPQQNTLSFAKAIFR